MGDDESTTRPDAVPPQERVNPDTKERDSEEFLVTWSGPEGEEEAGPLNVLWSLIESYRIDIFEVSLNKITGDFLEFMQRTQELKIETASSFTVMASRLLHYKSKALLPDPGIEDTETDPRLPPEIIQQLLEYRKFQLASEKIRDLEETAGGIMSRKTGLRHKLVSNEESWLDVSLIDLVRAYAGLLERLNQVEPATDMQIEIEEHTVEEKIELVRELLEKAISCSFLDLFEGLEAMKKSEIVATFLALLEMTKNGEIVIRQKRAFGEIVIFRKSAVVS